MSLPRLPLPGEKPLGVWRPRRRKSVNPYVKSHPSRWWRILPVLGFIAVLLLLTLIWQWTRIPVTLDVNGQASTVLTHHLTVRGVLRAADIKPADTLYIDADPRSRVKRDQIITVAQLETVLVHHGDDMHIVHADSHDPYEIVKQAGLTLFPGDEVRVIRAVYPDDAQTTVPVIPRELAVVSPRRLIIEEGATRVSLDTTEPSLAEALSQAGYIFYESDVINPPLWTPLNADTVPPEGLVVRLERSGPLTLDADGKTYSLRSRADTVGGLLDTLGIALTGKDYVVPSLTSPVEAGMEVRVVRVREELLVDEETLPYETVYVPDPQMEIDNLRIVQVGREGVLNRQTRVRHEDGVEVSRISNGEWVARQPQAQVEAYGIKIVMRTLQSPYGQIEYWRTMRVLATSYSPLTAGHKKPGDPGFGIAAAGVEVVRGIVAVDPNVINLYQWMYIPTYGIGRALDTGGAVKGLRIDLGYDDANLYNRYEFIDIYLMPPVPPPDQINWVLPVQE